MKFLGRHDKNNPNFQSLSEDSRDEKNRTIFNFNPID